MGILDKILKRKKMNNEMPFFWEDDYCQIEVVPRKNTESINMSFKIIEEFTLKTRTENGFTDVYMREDLPFPTIDEEIRIDTFTSLLTNSAFEKATQFNYDGRGIKDCTSKSTNAYFFDSFNLFYDCKNEFINNIWTTGSCALTNSSKIVLITLYEIGEGNQLVLVDWNSLELIDLSNRNKILKYLKSH